MFTSPRFHPVHFLERVRDFFKRKQLHFDSIDFNGNTAEKHVLHF
ncbi:unnamed protein product [Staurois parvus]|uniref:Uncharacterized protein n=1 Tax=Staurois parvus TaxID=386267 RepID=A0ABN9CE44_9NEOB|nr:unnamed protein product [Staurois parvus]